jgi:hypothetical protein
MLLDARAAAHQQPPARGSLTNIICRRRLSRIIAEARSDQAPHVTLIADVPEKHDPTFYVIAGDWFAWLTLAILAAVLVRIFAFPEIN